MENLSEQEHRSKRAYQLVAIFGLIAAVAVVVWFTRPPVKVDLRFLNALHPRETRDDNEITLDFDQSPAVLKKIVGDNLVKPQWDVYAPTGSPDAEFTYRGRRELNVSISPNYPSAPPSPAAPKPGGKPIPGPKGTTITIRDPAGIVILK